MIVKNIFENDVHPVQDPKITRSKGYRVRGTAYADFVYEFTCPLQESKHWLHNVYTFPTTNLNKYDTGAANKERQMNACLQWQQL